MTPFQDKEEALLGAPREIRPIPGQNYILLTWLPPADESILVRGYQVFVLFVVLPYHTFINRWDGVTMYPTYQQLV